MNYIVITPVRNEQERFARTIASIIAQTVRPRLWIIVDDGSNDNTGALADQATMDHAWIRVVHRPDRGFRQQGGGVIEAFYDGYALLNTHFSTSEDLPRPSDGRGIKVGGLPASSALGPRPSTLETPHWDFLAKLDGDLEFAPDYFERCLKRFADDPKLGIGGGRVYCRVSGAEIEDSPGDPSFHVRGATKIYRRATWDAIGGLLSAPGWDTLDELKANMLGWKTCSFEELKVLQLKPTGSADGCWRNWFKNGRANYITGYHPLFMLSKCLKRLFRPPIGIGSAGLFCGFASGYVRGVPQVADMELIGYLRRQQINRLLFRESLWS